MTTDEQVAAPSTTGEPAFGDATGVCRHRAMRSLLAVAFLCMAASTFASDLLRPDNLLAWCIVPFDAEKRGPAARIAMLRDLGITQYAWDWRDEHLPQLAEEIRLAREHNIRLRAIWLWIDRETDTVGQLGHGNRFIIESVRTAELPVEFWVGFHENYFAGFTDEERLQRATAMISHLRDEAAKVGGTIALYNHGGWFGEPENELAIIEAVGASDVGMVFNFHHAHDMIERWPALLPRMLPHLRAVNLNGMNPAGPKILPVGSGTHERAMLRALLEAGYTGPIGILGHVDDEDVAVVLRRNIDGVREVARALEETSP